MNGPTYQERMLDDRTVDIIMITKRFGSPETIKPVIAQYMSETCGCPYNYPPDSLLYRIVNEAVFDFFRCCSERQDAIAFWRTFIESRYEEDIDRMICALSMVQVCRRFDWDYKIINGWHETEFSEKIDKGEWKPCKA